MILAPGAGEQSIVADPMEPTRQGVEEKAADELVSSERHDLLPSGAGLAVILVAEGDPDLIEPEKAAVRYRDPVDRKSVGSGKSVSVRVDLGGRRIIIKKKRK